MKAIRVMHLIAANSIGGAEHVLLDMCRSLESREMRFRVGLFVLPGKEKDNAFAQLLEDNLIPVHFVEMHFPLNPREILNLLWLFQKTKPHVVHCHGFRADLFGGLAARLCGIPAVSSVHGLVGFSRKMRFYTWFDLKALRLFNWVLPVSARLEEELREKGVPAERIHLLPNVPALNEERSARGAMTISDRSALNIGFVGRLSPEKGISFLLEAMAELKATLPIFLHIAGDGQEREKVRTKVEELGLTEHVRMYGHLADPHEVYDLLDILVLPSLTEGTPLTLLEGMSLGLPVIASRVGGIPDVVKNGENGITVEPGSVPALTESILFLAGNPRLRQDMGRAARESVAAGSDHKKWEQEILGIYKRCGGPINAFS